MYDPQVGRWLSEDPSGLGPDPNKYRYVHNSPTNFTDPSGLYGEPSGFDEAMAKIRASPFGLNGESGWLPSTPDPPALWQEPYDNNPEAQEDFDELRSIVENAPPAGMFVKFWDPCVHWANNVKIPLRFNPNYGVSQGDVTRPDKAKVTVQQVWWTRDGLLVDGVHTAFKVRFPDGMVLYFDEGGPWSTTAGALGGADRWFRPCDIPSDYINERSSL